MTSNVTLIDVTKYYGSSSELPVIDSINAEIGSGELVTILGPSGCGKTTVLKIVAGLLDPSSGDVLVDNQSVVLLPPERRPVAMVLQKPLLFPHMTVEENIGFGLEVRKFPREEIKKKVGEYLEKVRLPGFGQRYPSELSGGQEQRVALARALITSPSVLLLDEPLSQLDANLRVEMRQLIRQLQQDLGLTTIFVTHDQEEAVSIADQIVLFFAGKIAQRGVAREFYTQPASMDIAKFFGTQNLIPGSVVENRFETSFGSVSLPERFTFKKGKLVIRQESIKIGKNTMNTYQGDVQDIEYMGTHSQVRAKVGTDLLTLHAPPYLNIEKGSVIDINLPINHLWVVEDA